MNTFLNEDQRNKKQLNKIMETIKNIKIEFNKEIEMLKKKTN